MDVTAVPFDQVSLYIGSKEGYSGKEFDEDKLTEVTTKFQKGVPKDQLCPLRITPTKFLIKDYVEKGWEVTAINCPRFQKKPEVIYQFMKELGEHLLEELKQDRIHIVLPKANRIWMLESKEAE